MHLIPKRNILRFDILGRMKSQLDNPEIIKTLDPSGMLSQIMAFPDHLSHSLCRNMMSLDMDENENLRSVCFCGMGGSAISGDILKDILEPISDRYIHVLRGHDFPGWVNEETLIIAISYSGNTVETLRLFEKAIELKRNIVSITSGGRLMQRSMEENIPVVRIPSGFQPRAALGYLLGASARVLETAGVAPIAEMLQRSIPVFLSYRSELSMERPTEFNAAKKTAERLFGKIPVIYATASMRSAAIRMQTQLNENSKTMSFVGELPECNHNHIVGWLEDRIESKCLPVFLYNDGEDSSISEVLETTVEILQEAGKSPLVLRCEGNSNLEKIIRAIMLGDFTSYYLALLKGVDPTPVRPIEKLKERMR